MADDIALKVIKDFERVKNNRYNFENQWREIAERFIPSHSELFDMNGLTSSPGEKRTEYIFDSTPSIALGRFASIVDSLLTPRGSTWHRLKATDPNLNKVRDVLAWFEEVNRILFQYRYAPSANFASQNNNVYSSIGAYGTGTLFVDSAESGEGIRYRNVHLAEFFLCENHQGLIDKAYRRFEMTARQAVQKWGERLPEKIINAAEKNPEQRFLFIHAVYPNPEVDPARIDADSMEYVSAYISQEGQTTLSTGGYNTFPYPTSRYMQVPGEVYGRSPAMEVLPAVKTLNEEKKTILKQGHRTVDPVLLAHDDGVIDTFSMKPGALNAGGVSADGRPLIQTLPTGNIAIGKDLMDDERATINDAFLITVFQILTETPRMTATEVLERTREKGVLLSPIFGRIQNEYLAPLIDRELDLLARQGMLPPMPEILIEAGAEFKIEYDSPMSRAQQAEEATGLLRTIEPILNIAGSTGNAEMLDHFDWDTIIPELSAIQGVPQRWLKSIREVSQMRDARAQLQEQQAQADAAPGQAAMLNAVTKASQ